jgi:acyl-coenzyme A thioesterase PaaI-like protein
MQVFDLVARVRDVSPAAAHALLGRVIPRIIPLAGGLDLRVREWTPTRCVMTMPLTRKTRNHVQSMYFGAQMTLADLTVGILLFQRYPMGPFGGVIKTVQADFRSKAKGTIRCECELDSETASLLDSVRTSEAGKAEAWIPLQLIDPEGTVVTDVRFLIALKRFGPPER